MNYNISIGTAQSTPASIIGTIVAIATIIATVMLFRKAGKEGWEAIIPFYNSYTEYKLFWTTKMFWVSLLLKTFVVIGMVPVVVLGEAVGYSVLDTSSPVLLIIGVALMVAAIIAWIVIDVKKTQKMAHAFNKRGMFTVGLYFFNAIFRMILAFGNYEYAGANL